MGRYMVIYHAPAEAFQQTETQTAEEMKKGMEQWMVWAQNCGDRLVDMGTPLAKGQKLLQGGGSVNSQREVCGYSILQAESMEEAKNLLQDHPHLKWRADCEIEVHEAMPLPGS